MRFCILVATLLAAIATTGCVGDLAARAMGPDPVEQHIETMESTAMVPYFINFHKDPAVGQFAVFKSAMGEEWYGIVGGQSGAWLVEKRAPVPGQEAMLSVLMEVDDQGWVKQAWAAPYDPEAEEQPTAVAVKVMDKPEPVKAGAAQEGPKPSWSKESFAGLECEVMTLDKTKIWYSPKVQFGWMLATEQPSDKGGMAKMTYDGNVSTELVKQGKEELAPSAKLPEKG